MQTKPLRLSSANYRALTIAGLGALVVLGAFLVATNTDASTYFRARGKVIETNDDYKTITVYLTHLEKGWPAVRIGRGDYTVRISRDDAGVFKPNSKGQLVRLSVASIDVGDDVSIVGYTRTDGTLDATKVVIRE